MSAFAPSAWGDRVLVVAGTNPSEAGTNPSKLERSPTRSPSAAPGDRPAAAPSPSPQYLPLGECSCPNEPDGGVEPDGGMKWSPYTAAAVSTMSWNLANSVR